MEFKVGNKVQVRNPCSGCTPGIIYTVYYNKFNKSLFANDENMNKKGIAGCSCWNKGNWILVDNTNMIWSLK